MNFIKKMLACALVACAAVMPAAAQTENILGALGSILSNVTSKSDFDLSELEGTWTYSSPAVTMKSSNAASSIGGVGASALVENKLSTYYNKLGLNKTVLTVDKDMNFTLKANKITLKGTIERDGDEPTHLIFNFSAASKFSLGKVSAIASKSSATNTLSLTFDASKVISILDKVSSFTGNSTLQAVSSIVNTYDGIYAGAKFKKSK